MPVLVGYSVAAFEAQHRSLKVSGQNGGSGQDAAAHDMYLTKADAALVIQRLTFWPLAAIRSPAQPGSGLLLSVIWFQLPCLQTVGT